MFAPVRPFGSGDVDAARQLVDHGAERSQCIEVEVDGAVADAAAAEIGNERMAQAVQQRAAEQNRNAARPRKRVDLGTLRDGHVGRVENQDARLGAARDVDAVNLE